MTLRFTKMHGLGNDFIVIDSLNQEVNLSPEDIRALARRDTGIGFDQCLLVEVSRDEGIDFFYRIFNANGHEVGQCGNGARCLARFIEHYGLSTKKRISVATCTTKMQLELKENAQVRVDLGRPQLAPAAIPLNVRQQAASYQLPLQGDSTCQVHAISVGNPHAVFVVEDLEKAPVSSLGKQISEHPLFPEQSNVGFMQLVDANHIRLRVYERGCGETQACGSGAVAAAALGRLYYRLGANIEVSLAGGNLLIEWPDLQGPIYLTGPASFVYEGVLLPGE